MEYHDWKTQEARPDLSRTSTTDSDMGKSLPTLGTWRKLSVGTERVKHQTSRKLSWPRGGSQAPEAKWRTTVNVGAGVAVIVLVINVILLIYGFTRPLDDLTRTRVLMQGDCHQTQGLFTLSHLLINIVSTILLATSNSAMQCLVAPSRKAVDRAHSEGKWVDVGVSSFRNWAYMEQWRKWCWALLLLSSLPLHLLYNAVIFSATSANEYFVTAVPSNFLDNPVPVAKSGDVRQQILHDLVSSAQSNQLTRMDNGACINAYNQDFVSQFSNLLVVTRNVSTETDLAAFSVFPTPAKGSSYLISPQDAWLCGDPSLFQHCDTQWLAAHPESFNLSIRASPTSPNGGATSSNASSQLFIDHCLAQQTEPNCTLQFSTNLMILVLICNVVKVGCFLASTRVRNFTPLITLGDAIASFLRQPDHSTTGLGPISAADVREAVFRARIFDPQATKGSSAEVSMDGNSNARGSLQRLAIRNGPWTSSGKRWFEGVGTGRWSLAYTIVWLLGVMIIGMVVRSAGGFGNFLPEGLAALDNVSMNFLLVATTGAGVIGNAILANVLQLVLSLIYLSYNGLLTRLMLSREFTNYAEKREVLRVSVPEGDQKGTPWLNLPYRFGLPMLFLSANIHWGLSETVFLAEVRTNNPQGGFDVTRSISCLGYSPFALVVILCIGLILMAVPIGLGFKRYAPGIPLVESNSIAISAACHSDGKSSTDPVQFLKYGIHADSNGTVIGFSDKHVLPLKPGQSYGIPHKELSAVNTQWPLQQKILLPAIGLLNTVKLILVIIWFCLGTGLDAVLHVFIPQALSGLLIVVSLLMAVLLIYIVTRTIVFFVRWRKQWIYRRFGWHVGPEMLFTVLFLILAVANFAHARPRPEDAGPAGANINVILAWSASLVALFLLSTGIEYWLWHQQYRRGGLSILRSVIPGHAERWDYQSPQ